MEYLKFNFFCDKKEKIRLSAFCKYPRKQVWTFGCCIKRMGIERFLQKKSDFDLTKPERDDTLLRQTR